MMQQSKLKSILLALLLFALVVGIFFQVRNFEFLNFDDNQYITENAHVRSGLSKAGLVWAFTSEHGAHWHPLSWLSHQLDLTLFGLNPAYHHLANVFWHALNSVLFYLLLRALFGSHLSLFFIAAIFALHPMRVESVAWVTERKDVLSMFFGLCALHSYVAYAKYKKTLAFILVHLFLLLGLLAKPSVVVLPILMLLLDYWPLGEIKKNNFIKLVGEKSLLLAFALGSALVSIWAQSHGGALKNFSSIGLFERISHMAIGYFTYLGKSLWPTHFSVFYPMQFYPPGLGVACWLVIILLGSLAYKKRFNQPYLLFAVLWFVITLLPVIGLVQIGWQAYADRWAYWPHVGLGLALAGGVPQLKYPKKTIYTILILLVLGLGIKTSYELMFWKNSETLFTHALANTRNNFMAHTNLGQAIESKNQALAEQHYIEALRLNPTFPQALNNLGNIKARRGDLAASIELFSKALQVNPSSVKTQYNLALSYYASGNKVAALIHWLRLARLDPGYQSTWNSLAHLAMNDHAFICAGTISPELKTKLKQELLLWKNMAQWPQLNLMVHDALKCL